MRVADKAIVLQSVKHGDRQHIVKLYTRGHGLVTVIASAGKSPGSKIRTSALRPLTLLEVNYTLRQNREIQRLGEASCYYVHDNIPFSLAKLSLAQFINELLQKTLKEQHAGPALYDFIENCLNFLNDAERDFANLHLHFLRELSHHLGFEPHDNLSPSHKYFDCREGAFGAVSLPFPLGLGEDDSVLFSRLLKCNLLREKLDAATRHWLLDIWLAYYRLHVPNFETIKSLDVLKEVGRA